MLVLKGKPSIYVHYEHDPIESEMFRIDTGHRPIVLSTMIHLIPLTVTQSFYY